MIQKIAGFILYRLLGWRIEGEIPWNTKRLMLVFLPHTSNWDFVIACLFIKAEGINVTIFAKDAFYFFPFTYCYNYFKVVPVRRDKRNNFVQQAASRFDNVASLWVAMAPEGTRDYQTHLKSGYYYLAIEAKIPLSLVGPDFQNRVLTLLEPRAALASFEEDADDLVNFSRDMMGKRPDLSI